MYKMVLSDDVLEAVAVNSPFARDDLDAAYAQLKSYDLVIAAVEIASQLGSTLEFGVNVLQRIRGRQVPAV
jgi:hypothetical protein